MQVHLANKGKRVKGYSSFNSIKGILEPSELMQDWIDSTAEFLKSLDSKHLITVGTEGFLGSSTPGEWTSLHHMCALPPCCIL